MNKKSKMDESFILERKDFRKLLDELKENNYKIVAPTIRTGAIIYDEIDSENKLPEGWTENQKAGFYRIEPRRDKALFGYPVGPYSWKKFLFPPKIRLFQAVRKEHRFEIKNEDKNPPKYAFVGVRSCDLHAIATQDQIFIGEKFTDSIYKSRREQIFIVAVNCGQPGGTCFCVSMNTGPKVTFGYDIVLTEVLEEQRHYFVAQSGTQKGERVLRQITNQKADLRAIQRAEKIINNTAENMGLKMNTKGIKELLFRNPDNPVWDEVSERCLTCANCTMVCPTCFCTTIEDTTDLQGETAERWRRWDSCFTLDFSYLHGGSVRTSVKSRYRQWMTHKLASWIGQFDISGCVGCGRCITWCPVGIDITEEVRAIRESESNGKMTGGKNEKS
jgi:ferredoxin